MSGRDKSIAHLLRKQFYHGKTAVECVVCHVKHNLKRFGKKLVLCKEQLFDVQKTFDPNVTQPILKGPICDNKYKTYMASQRTKKRKVEDDVSLYLEFEVYSQLSLSL